MQLSGQSNDAIHPADVQALSKLQSDQGLIFSLYLDLRSGEQVPGSLVERFNILMRETAQKHKLNRAAPAYQEEWNQEAGRMRHWLENQSSFEGLGLVLFSGTAAHLWQSYLVPAPVFDRLAAGARPYVRPLEILLNEFPCTLVVLIDARTARLVEVFLGKAEEIGDLQTMPVTGSALNEYARSVAERAEIAWRENACTRLVIGGSDETLDDLRAALPEVLREHLSREIHLSPQAELSDILGQVQEINGEQEQQLEAQRVEELITGARNHSGAVLGSEQTLLAVREKRVHLLITEEDFHPAGGECPNCGFMTAGDQGVCLLCGMALRPEPDIVEVALKRVLDMGGEIEILRSPGARHALDSFGRVGALLRPTGTLSVKETANQALIARNGVIDPDILRDETVEESFPASDPPG